MQSIQRRLIGLRRPATCSIQLAPPSRAMTSAKPRAKAKGRLKGQWATMPREKLMRHILKDCEAPPFRPAVAERAKSLFRLDSQFIGSASTAEELPDWDVPEIAFAGRSNAGKSSLINAVVAQPGLVHASKTPGRTQKLNFFSLGGKLGSGPDIALIDMPGYGFAKAPKSSIRQWHTLIEDFLSQRTMEQLRRLFILIDARRGVMPVDEDLMFMLGEANIVYQVVITKADLLSMSALEECVEAVRRRAREPQFVSMHPVIHITSGRTGLGVDLVRSTIVDAVTHFDS